MEQVRTPSKKKKKKKRESTDENSVLEDPELNTDPVEETPTEADFEFGAIPTPNLTPGSSRKKKKRKHSDDAEEAATDADSSFLSASSPKKKKRKKKKSLSKGDSEVLPWLAGIEEAAETATQDMDQMVDPESTTADNAAREPEGDSEPITTPKRRKKKKKHRRSDSAEEEEEPVDDESGNVVAGVEDVEVESGFENTPELFPDEQQGKKEKRRSSGHFSDSFWSDPLSADKAWRGVGSQKSSFSDAGVQLRTGTWSEEETRLLKANVEKFLENHEGVTAYDVIFNWERRERSNFYRSVSEGLRRPLFSTYRRLCRLYNPDNRRGKWTPEECSQLLDLQKKYGNNWSRIGAEIGRSAENVADKYRHLCALPESKDEDERDLTNKRWTDAEVKKLVAYVHEIKDVPLDEVVDDQVPWEAVAIHMKTRTPLQCRLKFRLTNAGFAKVPDARWTPSDTLALFDMLYSGSALEEGEIPWQSIQETSWPWAPIAFLKRQWGRLRSMVPKARTCTLEECLEYLHSHQRNRLVLKCARAS